ncbi:hypothetical protein OE88DRAFT_1602912, partial [Heliocybe sulcata]
SNARTEFDILKASHRFLREDGERTDDKSLPWEEQVAKKYYDNLYREFAVCDLKHYKSGNFALRWRTEEEVLSGAGETTCGNTRCRYHDRADEGVQLKTLEVPFGYEEQGAYKSCLVKLVLCARCIKKLMWKREKERERLAAEREKTEAPEEETSEGKEFAQKAPDGQALLRNREMAREQDRTSKRGQRDVEHGRPRRRSRSLSPRVRKSGRT